MNGFRPSKIEKKERKRLIVFSKGYHRGVVDERERIISDLLNDAVITTNLDVKLLERVVEIVEG